MTYFRGASFAPLTGVCPWVSQETMYVRGYQMLELFSAGWREQEVSACYRTSDYDLVFVPLCNTTWCNLFKAAWVDSCPLGGRITPNICWQANTGIWHNMALQSCFAYKKNIIIIAYLDMQQTETNIIISWKSCFWPPDRFNIDRPFSQMPTTVKNSCLLIFNY